MANGYIEYASKEYVGQQLESKADATHNHDSSYDMKGAADTALESAKTYADSVSASAASLYTVASLTGNILTSSSCVATCEGFELRAGIQIAVKFNSTVMSPIDSSATLNINETGAYPMLLRGSGISCASGAVVNFVFTGDAYEVMGEPIDPPATPLPLSVLNGGTGQTSIADTTYTAARYRASTLNSTETTPTTNGVIAWTYE